jgi:hypothetical protein
VTWLSQAEYLPLVFPQHSMSLHKSVTRQLRCLWWRWSVISTAVGWGCQIWVCADLASHVSISHRPAGILFNWGFCFQVVFESDQLLPLPSALELPWMITMAKNTTAAT